MNSDPDDIQADDPFQKQREKLVALLASKGLATEGDFLKLLNELALEDQFGPIRELVESYTEGREQRASGLTLRDSVSAWRFDISEETGALMLRSDTTDGGQLQVLGTLAVGSRFGTIAPPATSAEDHLSNRLEVGTANGGPINLVAEGTAPLALEIVAVTDASEVPDYSGSWLGSWRRKFMIFTGWGLVPQTVLHAIATRAGEGARPAIQVTPHPNIAAWRILFATLGYFSLASLLFVSKNLLKDAGNPESAIYKYLAAALDTFTSPIDKLLTHPFFSEVKLLSSTQIAFGIALVMAGLIYSLVRRRKRRSLRLKWERTSKRTEYPAKYKLTISGGHNKSDAPMIRCHITRLWP